MPLYAIPHCWLDRRILGRAMLSSMTVLSYHSEILILTPLSKQVEKVIAMLESEGASEE